MIILLGKNVLHTLLSKINDGSPSWFSIIVDEASDVSHKEQFILSVRWVDNSYAVHEDPLGLQVDLHGQQAGIGERCKLPHQPLRNFRTL